MKPAAYMLTYNRGSETQSYLAFDYTGDPAGAGLVVTPLYREGQPDTPEIAELRRRYLNMRALVRVEPGLPVSVDIAMRLVLDLVTPRMIGDLLGEPWDDPS